MIWEHFSRRMPKDRHGEESILEYLLSLLVVASASLPRSHILRMCLYITEVPQCTKSSKSLVVLQVAAEVRGQIPAIMGMGAFGVENVRTCLEHGASKVWLICRRKNLAMPRMLSWFINQSLYAPPGAMCLDAMKPMYSLIPDDPWNFYCVVANKEPRGRGTMEVSPKVTRAVSSCMAWARLGVQLWGGSAQCRTGGA